MAICVFHPTRTSLVVEILVDKYKNYRTQSTSENGENDIRRKEGWIYNGFICIKRYIFLLNLLAILPRRLSRLFLKSSHSSFHTLTCLLLSSLLFINFLNSSSFCVTFCTVSRLMKISWIISSPKLGWSTYYLSLSLSLSLSPRSLLSVPHPELVSRWEWRIQIIIQRRLEWFWYIKRPVWHVFQT